MRERLTRLGAEQLDLEERTRQIESETEGVTALEADALERAGRHETEQLGLAEVVTEAQVRTEAQQTALTEARVSLAQLGEKRASLEAAALRAEAGHREVVDRIAALEASISESVVRAAELRTESDATVAELAELREERARLQDELIAGREVYEKRTAETSEEEVAVRDLRRRAEELTSQVSSLETRLARTQSEAEHLTATIEERHRLQLEKVVGEYHLRPEVGQVEHDRLAELKGLIERMGADINLTAIEEYEEINKRHGFLAAQRDDLEDAVGQLERAINKINRTSRKLFRETFDAINAQFQITYPRLFRGGRAHLALNGDDADVLEAGVEIMAQPPGKKNTTVEQLSGGEKALTAVALLFAIFLIKPSPFCLLDEVDAPARRRQRGPLQRDHPADDRAVAVHRHHPQQADHGDRRPPVRRDHAGAGRIEAGHGQPVQAGRGRARGDRRLSGVAVGQPPVIENGGLTAQPSAPGDTGTTLISSIECGTIVRLSPPDGAAAASTAGSPPCWPHAQRAAAVTTTTAAASIARRASASVSRTTMAVNAEHRSPPGGTNPLAGRGRRVSVPYLVPLVLPAP